ncbi:helix-turn-helix domain protein [Desulfosporosinus acididurans]|uniref:Helix-turn-helix domain protein n=1 Tax=Desulfosporosinus acididurans TaxID=476652 RepID=A0A0J1FK20_9FIRM|nr:helix-turn-helix domain-containing protein [Desulfosporosinus acididurans]KLU63824.1 helix-turn-helix domain protein [Desulfosporosinus acididurans]
MDNKYYTVAEIAELLHVRKNYVYELIDQNKIKAIRLSERRIRIPASSIQELIDRVVEVQYNSSGDVQPPKRGRRPNVS